MFQIGTCKDWRDYITAPLNDFGNIYDGSGLVVVTIDTRIIGFKAFLGLSSTGL